MMPWRRLSARMASEPVTTHISTCCYVIFRAVYVSINYKSTLVAIMALARKKGQAIPWVNLRIWQNGRHFVDEKLGILIKISLKLVPKGRVDNDQALVWIMAWRRSGDKPLSKQVLIWFIDAYMRHQGETSWDLVCWRVNLSIVLEELIDCGAVGCLCMYRDRSVYFWNIRSTRFLLHDLKLIAFLWVSDVNFLESNVFVRPWLISFQ